MNQLVIFVLNAVVNVIEKIKTCFRWQTIIPFLLLVCSSVCAYAQEDVSKFIPSGYTILDSISGDLNGDKRPDLILVLQHEGESDRPFLLLIRDQHQQLHLAARNNYLIFPADLGGTMGDPYIKTTINGSCFTVEHYYGSRDRVRQQLTFCYQPSIQDWVLQQEVTTREDAINPDATKTVVKKGKRLGYTTIKTYQGGE
ncbi:MAG: hypothetical protein JO154_10330 [Chitinophaga sp.]|uniref:hypothetical protein n=1 Tax=Chitinophaga sp. TaxID=1869181 RepID=UPI0025BFDF60|nr:hypothetical protein [Chitinophaga sp.]MBV8252991.1 hypothetical protein [Chitinophaga sp.]